MKTQIIQLESHDDVISVKDKMGWGQTPRVLLVWPRRGQVLNHRLDLVFLKRHSAKLGAQLALVTRDSNVRYFADTLDIPVYSNIRKAEERHWRRSSRKRRKTTWRRNSYTQDRKDKLTPYKKLDLDELYQAANPKPPFWLVHPVTRLTLFTLGVSGVLAITAILFPSAEIHMRHKTEIESVIIPVKASSAIDTVDLSGKVPARQVGIIVEGRGSTPSTGKMTIPDKKAIGMVIFTNLTSHQITIPLGTIVSTTGFESIRFSTQKAIDLSPESVSEALPVKAVIAGSSGNVRSNSIVAIEGPLGLDLTVTNPKSTGGGTNQTSLAPSDEDYQVLADEMLTALYETAVNELHTQLGSYDLVLQTDPKEYNIIEETFTPSKSQPSDRLSLILRVEYQAYVAQEDDLFMLGQSILETNKKDKFIPILSTLDIENMSSLTKDRNGNFSWEMQATWQVESSIDPVEAVNLVLWRKPEDAVEQLNSTLPIDGDITIIVSPKWWPRLPILPFRVNVIASP